MTTTYDDSMELIQATMDDSEWLGYAGAGNGQFLDRLLNDPMYADMDDDERTTVLAAALSGMTGADLATCYHHAEAWHNGGTK